MIEKIRLEVERREITRLCHFTPSRNLLHIASGTLGVLATRRLKGDERAVYNPTDLQRLDQHEGHICCSIEYPNAWYFDQARGKDVLFLDWVILMICPSYLWAAGTRFCPHNAAKNYGRDVAEGHSAFVAMFADSVQGAYGRTYVRTPRRLPCCPTDEQAEVLIRDRIDLADILAIAVPNESQARNEVVRLRLAKAPLDRFKFVIAPEVFDKRKLSQHIRSGTRPIETGWVPRKKK